MAAGIVPPKGEPTHCNEPCEHRDCRAWRTFFETPCVFCGRSMEPGQRYYEEDGVPEHAICSDASIEEGRD